MYDLRPPYVVVLDELWDDPRTAARAERLLAALPADTPIERITSDQLPEAARRHDWAGQQRRMGYPPPDGDPGMLFGLMRFDGRWPERWSAIREAWPQAPGVLWKAYGYDGFVWFRSGENQHHAPAPDHVCRPAWRLHLLRGCPHKCFYCSLRDPFCLMLNVEEYVERLAALSARNPFQKTWLYDDDAEPLSVEPEFGGLPALMRFGAESADNHVIVHTKSANVDWLREFDHRGRTTLVWSLTGPTQSTLLEANSASMDERLDAAAKCQSWGYNVRFKYKPIVPVRGWREEIAAMTRAVFAKTRPDVISVFTLAWMDAGELVRLVDPELLDPVFVDGALAAAEAMGRDKVRPFPHDLRREVYEFCFDQIRAHDSSVPVSLCTESTRMWQELGPRLGLTPGNYPCGCGPQATPGLAALSVNPWRVAEPVAWDEGLVACDE